MSRRIKVMITVSAVLGFAIWKTGDLLDRMRVGTPPASDPNGPLKVEFYPR
jgi:hypothetical protein